MIDISQLTALISAFRVETEKESISPETVGKILQDITDLLATAIGETEYNIIRVWKETLQQYRFIYDIQQRSVEDHNFVMLSLMTRSLLDGATSTLTLAIGPATRNRAGLLTAEDYIRIQGIGEGAARRSRAYTCRSPDSHTGLKSKPLVIAIKIMMFSCLLSLVKCLSDINEIFTNFVTEFFGLCRSKMEYKTLNNGLRMPMVGMGVYDVPERETQRVVEDAISVGYRSIDTAAMYYNESGVGDAVRACGVAREELFITTKICDSCYTRDETMRSVDHSMRQLGLDYVDLMLIHWPVGKPAVMWHALEELYEQGLFKAIGVSNFYPNTFPMIVKGARVMPVVNQCETHVLYQQRGMMEYLQPYNVALEAWSPLAEGKHGIFKNPILKRVGEKYGKTAAQIALKFLIQNGIIIIPKTTHKERMIENIDLFDFTLTDDDLREIRCLDTGRNVTGWPSDALKYNPEAV